MDGVASGQLAANARACHSLSGFTFTPICKKRNKRCACWSKTCRATETHVFVNVKVNGLPCRFLVDTGASKSVIDKTYVKEIRQAFAQNHSTANHRTAQQHARIVRARLKSVTIGTVENRNYTLAAVRSSHVNSTYATLKTKKIQGILGSDLMMKEKMIIDYSTLKLSFA